MVSSEAAEVCRSVAGLVGRVQERSPFYASEFAPLRSDQLAELLRAFSCRLVVSPHLDGEVIGMVLPAVKGIHAVVVPKDRPRTDRLFIVRHEVKHVVSEEVGAEAVYLLADHGMAFPERTGDLFAMADLIPGRVIRDLRRGRYPMRWAHVVEELEDIIRTLITDEWDEERVQDRARLRLLLFREHGI